MPTSIPASHAVLDPELASALPVMPGASCRHGSATRRCCSDRSLLAGNDALRGRQGPELRFPTPRGPRQADRRDERTSSAARACRSLKAASAKGENGSSSFAFIQRSHATLKASIAIFAPSRAVSSSVPRSRRAALTELATRACCVAQSGRGSDIHAGGAAARGAALIASANSPASTSSPPRARLRRRRR